MHFLPVFELMSDSLMKKNLDFIWGIIFFEILMITLVSSPKQPFYTILHTTVQWKVEIKRNFPDEQWISKCDPKGSVTEMTCVVKRSEINWEMVEWPNFQNKSTVLGCLDSQGGIRENLAKVSYFLYIVASTLKSWLKLKWEHFQCSSHSTISLSNSGWEIEFCPSHRVMKLQGVKNLGLIKNWFILKIIWNDFLVFAQFVSFDVQIHKQTVKKLKLQKVSHRAGSIH